jgi:type IV pilus assembly protein PilN
MSLYKVNLLPPRLQREGIIDVRRLILMLAAVLPVLLLLGCCLLFRVNYSVINNELTETRAQLAALAPALSRMEGVIRERTELEETIEECEEISRKHISWSGVLVEVGKAAPIDLWLTGLNIANKDDAVSKTAPGRGQEESAVYTRPNQLAVKGVSRSLPSIGIFIRKLNELPYFEEVELVKVNAVSEGMGFEITAKVKGES